MAEPGPRRPTRRSVLRATGSMSAAAALGGSLAGLTDPAAASAAPRPRATASASPTAARWDTMSDTWTAIDGLGRTLPSYDEVGPPRADRFVGLFYFLWLGQHGTDGPYDISKILAQDPDAINETDNPLWGPLAPLHQHHWAEPYFGYYLSDDTWVIRKHAQMLADAGVDTIIFDVTNNFTYKSSYHALLDTFAAVRADGGTTPQIAFLTPFHTPRQVVLELYADLYEPGTHADLWFRWKGKPLILADPAMIGTVSLTGSDGSNPSQLATGDTQGQSFVATEPFVAAGGRIPTWTTTDAAMTLTLYADGPGGKVLAQQRFENVEDNGTMLVTLDSPAPAGTYHLEESDPSGSIGWWSDPTDTYAEGQAYGNGQPVAGDRTVFVEYADSNTVAVKDFFTFRKPQPSYFVGPTGPDEWSWLEVAPQHVFTDDAGKPEQMSVGVAQNAVDGRLGSMSEPHALGRSYHDGTLPTDHSRTPEGLNVAEQWKRALDVDPEFVFVTGWNEWVASRYTEFAGVHAPVIFVDEFDWEHSRDIEPVRGGPGSGLPDGNDYQDAYYYQLVANIRRYKGVRPSPRPSKPCTITVDGRFDDWREVGPEFRDHVGDTAHRDHPGWGSAGRYVDTTGRNDIVATKVARDDDRIAFYARTSAPITPSSDPAWMMLFLDLTGDGDRSRGWEGFDFVVNRSVGGPHSTWLEASTGGWSWRRVAQISYACRGNELELAIPRSLLGLGSSDPVRLEFKWIDNMQDPGNILDTIEHGDAAPSGRFRYRYAESGGAS